MKETATYEYEVPTDEVYELPPPQPLSIREMPEDPTEEDRERILEMYKSQAEALEPKDDQTETAVLLFIDQCKKSIDRLDTARKAKTDPLRKQIADITEPFKKAIDGFEQLKGICLRKLEMYRTRKAQEIAAAQRKAIAEAAAAKAEQERIEREKREAAERERQQGNEAQAVTLEMQADEAAMQAAITAPLVVEPQKKTVDLGDSKITVRTTKDWSFANGMVRGAAYYRDDPRFKDIPDSCWKLDETAIGKLVRAGAKIPGVLIYEKPTTVSRGR